MAENTHYETSASTGASPPAWSNINWSTTYSSDEDSHSSASSQFLFADRDHEDIPFVDRHEPQQLETDALPIDRPDEDVVHNMSATSPLQMTMQRLMVDPNPIELNQSLYMVDDPIRRHTPPRTRRRTRSHSTHTGSNGGEAPLIVITPPVDTVVVPLVSWNEEYDDSLDSQGQPRLRPNSAASHYPTLHMRSLLAFLALVSVFLVVVTPPDSSITAGPASLSHPELTQQLVPHREAVDKLRSLNLEPKDLAAGTLQAVGQQQRPRMMHALGSQDTPLTYRQRPPSSPLPWYYVWYNPTTPKQQRQNHHRYPLPSETQFHLHALYISFLMAVVLWSIREVRREVQARRDHQEPLCCDCCEMV